MPTRDRHVFDLLVETWCNMLFERHHTLASPCCLDELIINLVVVTWSFVSWSLKDQWCVAWSPNSATTAMRLAKVSQVPNSACSTSNVFKWFHVCLLQPISLQHLLFLQLLGWSTGVLKIVQVRLTTGIKSGNYLVCDVNDAVRFSDKSIKQWLCRPVVQSCRFFAMRSSQTDQQWAIRAVLCQKCRSF